MKNIFIRRDEIQNCNSSRSNSSIDISGKLAYSDIYKTIPEGSLKTPVDNWEEHKLVEWRWRFMKFGDKKIVEISQQAYNDKRKYFNNFGQWVHKDISSKYDKYVDEQYYFYTHRKNINKNIL